MLNDKKTNQKCSDCRTLCKLWYIKLGITKTNKIGIKLNAKYLELENVCTFQVGFAIVKPSVRIICMCLQFLLLLWTITSLFCKG